MPTVNLPYSAKTGKPEGGVGSVREYEQVRARNTYLLGLQGSWRADVWGERSSLYESAEFQLQRAIFQRDDVQRTLIANVVTSYAELLALNDRLRISAESEVVLSEMLASVEMRMEKGDATIIDVEQQRAAVHSAKATVPVLEQQRVVALNRLASLLGTVPGELSISDRGLDTLKFPAVLPGVPSALLLRRPDVRVTEARLLGANADINVARARLLPPLDLTFEIGYGSFFLDRLIRPYSYAGSLAATLALTIFDHGKRKKDVAFSEAMQAEMVETYVKVIYDAVREVDDSLSSVRLMGRRVGSQQIAVDSSRRAWHSSIESYKALGVDYLVVLDTERSYQRNLDELYSARLDKYRGLINLFSALGGGVPMAGELPGDGVRPPALAQPGDYGAIVRSPADVIAKPGGVEARTEVVEPTVVEPKVVEPKIVEPKIVEPKIVEPKVVMPKEVLPREVPQASPSAPVVKPGVTEASPEDSWMIELAGLHEREKMTAIWQDIRGRFGAQMTNQMMLPRRQDGELPSRYRLFISRFPTAQAAETLCAALRENQFKCRTVSARLLKPRSEGGDGK
jgi:NodT family efflux transporter outer membrane factor (OMF) lipoprotein